MAIESIVTEPLVDARRPLTLHGERLVISSGWESALNAAGIAEGDDWQLLEGDALIADSATARCYRIRLANGERIYFKRDSYSLRRALGYLLRASRNAVEAFAYGQCEKIGIAAPELLAVAERRRFGMPVSSFIVTREVTGSMNLQEYVHTVWARHPEQQRQLEWRALAACLIRQLQLAHRGGFFHQDLKFRNLLVRENQGNFELFWIDAPRARRRRFRHRRGAIVDLSGLARVAIFTCSRFERMRFLRKYLGADAAPGEAASLYRQVAAHLSRRQPKALMLRYPENG